jgi:hypothetical protein
MASSGMLFRVALVRTDVSQELSASFIWMTRIGELGTTLAVTSNRRRLWRNTKCTYVLRYVRTYVRKCTYPMHVCSMYVYKGWSETHQALRLRPAVKERDTGYSIWGLLWFFSVRLSKCCTLIHFFHFTLPDTCRRSTPLDAVQSDAEEP